MNWSRHTLMFLASVVLLTACAEERAPINRVQPNVVRKADLEGEWFYQQTVIDMDTSANYSVIGDNAFWNLERVRWEIQENYLYARRSFEWVDNTDTVQFEIQESGGRAAGTTTTMHGEPYMGSIVAAYRIESHFDIRREYNPTTGEELNIISENTSDRPWNERAYMRVDWSMNLATDFDFDYFYYANGELQIDPVAYYVQEDGPEDLRPNFDYDEDGNLWYFDFVQQLTVHPATTYYEYYGTDVPTCWFFAEAGVDCATTTLTVRASFLRVDNEDQDFEPLEFNNAVTEVFGFWTIDRLRYNHREGLREFNRRRYAQLHNIWERSHTDQVCQSNEECGPASRCDDNISYQPAVCELPWAETHFDEDCETDDDCTLPGSRCHTRSDGNLSQCTIPEVALHSSLSCVTDDDCSSLGTRCLNAGRCTIPYADRQPKPVLFYLTGGWPEDLRINGMWDRLESEYDWTLRRAVAAAQLTSQIELARADGDDGAEQDAWERLDNLEMECESDSECDAYWSGSTCETEGAWAGHCTTPVRQMFYICNSPVRESDPEECGPVGRVVRLGDIRYNQLHYSREWNPLSPLGQSPTAPDPLTGRVFGSTVSLYDATDAVAYHLWEYASLLNGDLDPTDFVNGADLTHWVASVQEAQADPEAHARPLMDQEQIREIYRARNTEWMEALYQGGEHSRPEGMGHEVLPRAMQQLRRTGAFDPDRDPGRGFLHSLHRTPIEYLMMNDDILVSHGVAPGSELTDDVLDQASILSPEYRAWRTVQQRWLEEHNWGRNIYYADMFWVPYEDLANRVQGMDPEEAFNYIRMRTWESVIVHELGHNLGLYHNFGGSEDVVNFPSEWWAARTNNFTQLPRSRLEDPVDEDEIAGGLNDLGYSSVMDYGSNYASGERLGRYDRAAILFGYGRSMEVYRERPGGLGQADLTEWWSSGGTYLRFQSNRPMGMHYTELYNIGGRDLFEQSARRIVPISGLNDDLMSYTDPATGETLTRVPYIYCNDYRADLGENCHRWDFGFDTLDRMDDLISRDPIYFLNNNFRRGRVRSDADGFRNYMADRQYGRMKLMHDYYNLIDAICHMYYPAEACEEFMTDTRRGFGTYTVAIHEGFNYLARTIATPDQNIYDRRTRGDGSQIYGETGWIAPGSTVTLPLIDGRPFTTTWWADGVEDCGVHFWECLHHYGFYVNKLLALMVLGEAETFFVARDTAEDIRMWRISYYDDYADAIIRLVGGILAEDYADFAPYATVSEETDPDGINYAELFIRNYANRAEDPVERRRIPAEALPIDPYDGFTVQLYTAVIGFGLMHTNFDNRFITAARMWIRGGDHGVAPDVGTVDFEDPETGIVYSAVAREDGMGIAQRMIMHANELRARSEFCDDENPDALDACVGGLSPDEIATATREMSLYRDMLDIMVHLTAQYDNWLFSYGDPFNPGDVPEDW